MAAYVYHLNQIEQEKAAAEAKQTKAAERRATLQKEKQVEQAAKDAEQKAADEVKEVQVAEQAASQKKKQAEQAIKDADDNIRVEALKADEKERAKMAEASNDDVDADDKKSPRFRFRFWKKE